MDPYSPALPLALLCGLLAVALAVARHRRASPAAACALLLATAAVSLHVALGHRPGTPRAMSPVEFARAHPLPLLIVIGGLAILAATHRRRTRG